MEELADKLDIVSAERISDELSKLLRTDDASCRARAAGRHRLADRVLPELPALRLEIDEHHHHKDVYEHSLIVLTRRSNWSGSVIRSPPDLTLRLAALLHDIGKPATKRLEPGGVVTFHHHDVVGASSRRNGCARCGTTSRRSPTCPG